MIRRLRNGTKYGIYCGVVLLLLGVTKLLFRVRVEGRDRVRRDLNVIAVARHRSYWDIPLLVVALGWRNRVHFIARKGLMRNNILVRPFIRMFSTTIDRDNFRKSDFRRMLDAIKCEHLVAIFPEGTTRAKVDAKPGAIHFAKLTDKELLPINIAARGPYPPRYPFRFPKIVVSIGEPVSVEQLSLEVPEDVSRALQYRIVNDRLMLRVDNVSMINDKRIDRDDRARDDRTREGKTVGG